MKKTVLSKTVIMVAGILAAFIIVFSQSYYPEGEKKVEKAKTEKSDRDVFISTPDAVAHSQGVELNEQVPSFLQEELITEKKQNPITTVFPQIVARYFKVLFRTLISSNAP